MYLKMKAAFVQLVNVDNYFYVYNESNVILINLIIMALLKQVQCIKGEQYTETQTPTE